MLEFYSKIKTALKYKKTTDKIIEKIVLGTKIVKVMILLLFLIILIAVQARIESNIGKYCEVTGDDPEKSCYRKEIIATLIHSPNQLAIDKDTNNLYFSFDSGQGEYVAAVYKLDSKELSVLKGIKDAFAIATDDGTKEIYFGGTHGIYKYNPFFKSLKRLNINNLDVWWIFFKTKLYFIKFPSLNTYYYSNGSIRIIDALRGQVVHQMVVDQEDNIFFINNTGLYGITSTDSRTILLRDRIRFINMATDNNGHVYTCSEDGIYVITKVVQKVKKIVNLQGVLGFTFDKLNNLIYSDSHELVRLIPVPKS